MDLEFLHDVWCPAENQVLSITATAVGSIPAISTSNGSLPPIGSGDVAIIVDTMDNDLHNMQHSGEAGKYATRGDSMKNITSLARSMSDTFHTSTQDCKEIGDKMVNLGKHVFQVREWVKCGNGEVYINVLDSLETLMSERTDFVIALAAADRLLKDYEMQASMLFRRILSYNGTEMDKWNAKNFERELGSLDDMYGLLQTHQDALQGLSIQRQKLPLHSMVLQLDRHLRVSDSSSQIKSALQRYEEHEKLQKDVFDKTARKEAQIGISEVTVQHFDARIRDAERCLQNVASEKERLEKEISGLKEQESVDFEEHRAGLKKLKEETEHQRNELRKQRDQTLKQQEEQAEEQTRKVSAFARGLEEQLMATKDVEGNHIIFLIDRSGSMSGSRWNNTTAAIESFLAVRVQQGSQDKVSIICFNHRAEIFLSGHDIGFNFIDELRSKVQPDGGTAYAPAWIALQTCVQNGPPGSRLFVVQVTDGFSSESDVRLAAAHAGRLFQSQACLQRSMLTMLVDVECQVDQSFLEPLVKAANGGRLALDVYGQQVRLSSGIQCADMVQHFKLLATLPFSEADHLKCQISRVREMQRQEGENQRRNVETLNDMFEAKLKGIDARARALTQIMQEDCTVVAQKAIIAKERERLKEELDASLILQDNCQERLRQVQELRKREEAQLRSMQDAMEGSKANDAAVQSQLEEQQKINVEELKGIIDGSRQQLERLGTTDSNHVLGQIDQLKQVLVHHNQYRMLLQHAAGAIGSLQRFTKHFTASVREPLPDIKNSLAAKSNFVFKLLLEDRALSYKAKGEQLASSSNLKLYLEYEARAMGIKDDDVDDVVHVVLSSNIEAEDLCSACGVPDDEVDALIATVVEKLQEHVLETAGIQKPPVPGKVKHMKEHQKYRKKELLALKAKLKKTLPEEEVENVENQITEAESEIQALQEDIQSSEEAVKENQQAMKAASKSIKLVERAFKQCLLTYSRQCEKERVREIHMIFEDLYTSVVKSIRNFKVFTEGQKDALNDFSPAKLRSTRAAIST